MDEQVVTGPVFVTDGQADADGRRTTVDFAVDTGNGETHAVGSDPTRPDATIEVTFPSVVTVFGVSGAELLRKRRAGPGEWGRFGVEEHLIRLGDEPLDTAVGDLALTLSRAGQQVTGLLGDNRRYLTLGVKLGLTALAAMYPQAEHITARVATGLPVGLWSQELADAVAEAWAGPAKAGRREGRAHQLHYKGRDLTVRVVSCQVLAEGHAAWVTLPAERKTGYRLGLDIGARTVIPTILDEGYVAETYQLELGAEWALDQLDSVAARPLSPRERHDLKRALAGGQKGAGAAYVINLASGSQDVLPLARDLFVRAGGAIIEQLAMLVNLEALAGIDVSGGGAMLPIIDGVRAECRRRGVGGKLFVMDEPERRTARGYYQQLTMRAVASKGKGRKK